MKHFRKNGGFTLVELMVSILVGTIITGAAVTVLLLGLRINKSSTDTASRQNTTRILLSVLESLAEEGKITNVEATADAWTVLEVTESGGSKTKKVLLSYDSGRQAIFTGAAPTSETETGNPILEGVYASYVELNGQLLTFSVETADGSYSTSVCCRLIPEAKQTDKDVVDTITKPDTNVESTIDDRAARVKFLEELLSQKDRTILGTTTHNPGLILVKSQDANGNTIYVSKGEYYTQWYVGGTYKDGWNKDTPWCAAYISWCLNQMGDKVEIPTAVNKDGSTYPKINWYANVDDFLAYVKSLNDGSNVYGYKKAEWLGGTYTPQPGDLVFFDWIENTEENPQHMGVVLSVANDSIYTIEGNTAGRVALRKYNLSDNRILGYGVLNWLPNTNSSS